MSPARPLSPVAPAPPAHDDGLAPFFADRGRLASGAAERLATRPRPVSWLERARQGLPLRRTVLIADDEPTLRLLVTATIASGEIDVLQAADGDQAWELIERHQPALWVHGHTHTSFDYRIGASRIVCNPHGYGDENEAFDPGLVLDV